MAQILSFPNMTNTSINPLKSSPCLLCCSQNSKSTMALFIALNSRGPNLVSKLYPRLQSRLSPLCGSKKRCGFSSLPLENNVLTNLHPPLGSNIFSLHNFNNRVQSLGTHVQHNLTELWENLSTWFIKRTFQPSVIRKRRKTGFLTRQKTVGGRRVLARRKQKGRLRLGGC